MTQKRKKQSIVWKYCESPNGGHPPTKFKFHPFANKVLLTVLKGTCKVRFSVVISKTDV